MNDGGKRSTADTGGDHLAKGLEQQPLMDIQIDGELGEFIKVMRVLQDFPEVQSINIIQGSFKEFFSTKRFGYLDDGVTERKYMIAEIRLFSGKEVSVIEIERKVKTVSILICYFNNPKNIIRLYPKILNAIIGSNGSWDKEKLRINDIIFLTLRHGINEHRHRAEKLFQK